MLRSCVVMLQASSNGTAVDGATQCSNMAPATAEKAKPARPDTSDPANTETIIRASVRCAFCPETECITASNTAAIGASSRGGATPFSYRSGGRICVSQITPKGRARRTLNT